MSSQRGVDIRDADVIFGKSKEAKSLAKTHPGTLYIKELAQKYAAEYEKADKTPADDDPPGKVTKQSLNLMLWTTVTARGGRVLVKNKPTEPWVVARKKKGVSNLSNLFRRTNGPNAPQEPPSDGPTGEPSRRRREQGEAGAKDKKNREPERMKEDLLGNPPASCSHHVEGAARAAVEPPPAVSEEPLDAPLQWFSWYPSFDPRLDQSGRTLDSSTSMERKLLGPEIRSTNAAAARMETKRGHGGTCSCEWERWNDQDHADDKVWPLLSERPPLEPSLSMTDLSRRSELTDGIGSNADVLSVDLISQNARFLQVVDRKMSRRSDTGSSVMSFGGSSHGFNSGGISCSDNSYGSLIGRNLGLGDSMARSDGSNTRGFLGGGSIGMSSSIMSMDTSYGPQSHKSLDTFSINTPLTRHNSEFQGSAVSSALPNSVVSDDDQSFVHMIERMSAAGMEQGTEISSLTFQTHQMNEIRVRGGRMAVERQGPVLHLPNDTVIKTAGREDMDDDHSAITMGAEVDVCKLLERMISEPKDALLQIRCFGALTEIAWEHMTEDVTKPVLDSMQDLISIMKEHRHDAQVQGHCCMAFGWLASNNPALKRFIAFFGGVEAIVRALEEHKDDELTQANGCSALSSLARNDGPNQQKIVAEGGIKVVVRAMDHNLKRADVQKNGCSALAYIAIGSTANTIKVAKDDGVMAIVRAMRMHGENEEVQINGSWALGTLSSHITSVRDAVAKAGGIGAILSGMQHHPKSEEVQTSGCLSLQHLAHDQYLESFVDGKGVEVVLAAMNSFESNETVQLIGCIIIGKIAMGSMEAQETITFGGGVGTMLSVTQSTWTDLNVNNEARKALAQLSNNNNVAQKRISQAVVSAMEAARQDADVQANCCCTLEAIAKQDSESRQWILAAGGVKAVRAARLNHPDKDHIWAMTLASLTDNSAEEESTDPLAVEEILSIVNTMDQYEDEEPKQEQSCRDLVRLLSSNSHNPNVGGTFVSADGMETLITAMDLFPANLRIQGNGCASLYMLCVDNIDGRNKFMKEGGAQVLVSTMTNWPTRDCVQSYGCKVLELLATECSQTRKKVYQAGAGRVLHNANALFPGDVRLTKAANKTLSLLAREIGRESLCETRGETGFHSTVNWSRHQ